MPALVDDLPHHSSDLVSVGWRENPRQSVCRDVDLHGSAQKALQQRVVQLLGDTGSLGQRSSKRA